MVMVKGKLELGGRWIMRIGKDEYEHFLNRPGLWNFAASPPKSSKLTSSSTLTSINENTKTMFVK